MKRNATEVPNSIRDNILDQKRFLRMIQRAFNEAPKNPKRAPIVKPKSEIGVTANLPSSSFGKDNIIFFNGRPGIRTLPV